MENESAFYPESVLQLVELLKTLPGIGRRGAERLALAMLKWDADKLHSFGSLIAELPERITHCPECGNLAEKGGKCAICNDVSRKRNLLCVVENAAQIAAIEKSGMFHGLYHVLGGKLSPLDAQNGETLNFKSLHDRAKSGTIEEIILAFSSDVEGRATAIYTADYLKDCRVRITCPARGLPAGANLAYADGATIAAAFSGRAELN